MPCKRKLASSKRLLAHFERTRPRGRNSSKTRPPAAHSPVAPLQKKKDLPVAQRHRRSASSSATMQIMSKWADRRAERRAEIQGWFDEERVARAAKAAEEEAQRRWWAENAKCGFCQAKPVDIRELNHNIACGSCGAVLGGAYVDKTVTYDEGSIY